MKILQDHPPSDEQAARKRIVVLEAHFYKSSETLSTLISGFGRTNGQTPKAVMSKLMELETVHTTALKAQEAFYEKYKDTTPQGGVNYNEIRDDIGRHLDRIRAALKSKGISEDPE